MTPGEVLEMVIGIAALAAILVPVLFVRQSLRRKRDARLAAQWEWVLSQSHGGASGLAYVEEVYQYARTGSKAVIMWYGTGARQDTWFEGWHAPVGTYLLLRGFRRYGPHNANPNVFHVSSGGVHALVPGAAPLAWERQRRRASRAAARSVGKRSDEA